FLRSYRGKTPHDSAQVWVHVKPSPSVTASPALVRKVSPSPTFFVMPVNCRPVSQFISWEQDRRVRRQSGFTKEVLHAQMVSDGSGRRLRRADLGGGRRG